jgi:hypothetical protein
MKDYIPNSVKQIIAMQNKFKSQLPSMAALEGINKVVERQRLLTSAYQKFQIPAPMLNILEQQSKIIAKLPVLNFPQFNLPDYSYLQALNIPDSIRRVAETIKCFRKNPETQFSFLTDFEILNISSTEELKETLTSDLPEDDIEEKETLLNDYLVPVLENMDLHNLWHGANYVINDTSNPDRFRHCLTSLRTILEYLIDQKLSPKSELKDSDLFKREFKNYHAGKQDIEFVRVKRSKRIQYFTSKIDFFRIDFTRNDIEFICECYSILCNIHEPDIGITENQVRSLKVKTGITIWFLSHLYEIINKSEQSKDEQ